MNEYRCQLTCQGKSYIFRFDTQEELEVNEKLIPTMADDDFLKLWSSNRDRYFNNSKPRMFVKGFGWITFVYIDGVGIPLGTFKTEEAAIARIEHAVAKLADGSFTEEWVDDISNRDDYYL